MKKKITTDQNNQKDRDKHDGSYRPRGSQIPPRQQPTQQPPKQQPSKQQPRGSGKGKKK